VPAKVTKTKKTKLTSKWGVFVHVIAENIFNSLNKLNYKELVVLKREINKISSTNCRWVTYQLKDVLLVLVDDLIEYHEEVVNDSKQNTHNNKNKK